MGSLIGIAIFILDVVAVYDVFKGPKSTGLKIGWALIIIVFPLVGVMAYFLMRGKKP